MNTDDVADDVLNGLAVSVSVKRRRTVILFMIDCYSS